MPAPVATGAPSDRLRAALAWYGRHASDACRDGDGHICRCGLARLAVAADSPDATAADLGAALRGYCRHRRGCAFGYEYDPDDCDCGLTAVLRSADSGGPAMAAS